MRLTIASICFIALCLALTACAPFAPEIKDEGTPMVTQYYSLYDNAEIYEPTEWWRAFYDLELNAMVELALAQNLDIMQAWARLNQATARHRQAWGGLWPSLGLEAGYSAERRQSDTRAGAASTRLGSSENYTLGLFASYELDLWGRVDASVKTQLYTMEATQDDLDAMAESVAATTAAYWARIIAARQEIDLLHKQLDLNQKYLDLVELRYASGMASALDVFQQRQTVARTQTQLPLAVRDERLLVNDLKLLLGQTAAYEPQITRNALPVLTTAPNAGLPAQLLQNRPDVRAAGKRLYAAQWGIAQAQANRLPAIRLTASGQASSEDLTYLFSNWAAALAASLVAPLFEGGSRLAEVEYQKALAEENLNNYKQTVLSAANEVEAALLREKALREYLTHLATQVQAARLALDEATFHYINGLDSYLPVLTQLAAVQELELTQVNQQAELLVNRITLYRALGSGDLTGDLLTN